MSSTPLPFDRTLRFSYGVASEVAPGVRRLVARNPGPLTFKGTNTYLVGRREIAVIDPGPDDPMHRRAIIAAAGRGRITHILLTHAHRDHSDGVAALKAETGAITVAMVERGPRALAARRLKGAGGLLAPFADPDLPIADKGLIEGRDWSLKAIATPGHAPDHVAFAFASAGVLLSGDHVMGWNTTVVAPPEGHMGDYFSSLERLLDPALDRSRIYLSGHGETIREPQRLVRAYLHHRKMRENMVLEALRDGLATAQAVTARVYANLDPGLRGAATLSVLGHMEHLVELGRASCDGAPSLHQTFRPA